MTSDLPLWVAVIPALIGATVFLLTLNYVGKGE